MHQLVIHLFFCLSNAYFPEHLLCAWPCSWHQGIWQYLEKGRWPLFLWNSEKHKPESNFSSVLALGDGYVEILYTILSLWTFELLHKTVFKREKQQQMPFIWSICSSDKYMLNENQGSGTMAREQDQGVPYLQGTQSSNGGFSLSDKWGQLKLSEKLGGWGKREGYSID